jgi:hypothetical protein
LSAGTTYIYAVTAVNSSGESAKSQTVKAATPPQAVTAPVAQHYADGRITLAQFLQLGQGPVWPGADTGAARSSII